MEDIILSIATIFISVIALFISGKTAIKQNKIALFDKKLNCYNELSIYFESKRIYLPAELKFMGNNTEFNNSYKGDIVLLFSQLRLLFNKNIWRDVEEIDDLYLEIRNRDSEIDTYLSFIQEDPKMHEIVKNIKEFIEMEANDCEFPITESDEIEFKKTCDKNTIVINHPIDGDIRLNFYDLNSIQNETHKKVRILERKLFTNMEDEIRISK